MSNLAQDRNRAFSSRIQDRICRWLLHRRRMSMRLCFAAWVRSAVVAAAEANEKVARFLEGVEIVKVIHVSNKLVNLIVKPKK